MDKWTDLESHAVSTIMGQFSVMKFLIGIIGESTHSVAMTTLSDALVWDAECSVVNI